jgi:hypothetical protein
MENLQPVWDWIRERWAWIVDLPHFVHGLFLTLLGLVIGWLLGHWRRYRLWQRVHLGDAREVCAIEQILVKDEPDGQTTMRIRSCGSAPLSSVLPNAVAHDAFIQRAKATTDTNTLLDLKDQMGSYLLYLLTPWVCGMVRHGMFRHDAWVMAPVCEPGLLSEHQSSTILLVRRADLKRFLDWETCRNMQVEHGSDGARLITLWLMAHEFERQIAEVTRLKQAGKRSTFVETMYLLDLGLDMEELPLPTKSVPWGRYSTTLKQLGLALPEVELSQKAAAASS